MDGLNVRIKQLIEVLDISKTAFGEKINVSQAFISQLCNGTKQPSDRTIADMCREFNVNEEWLNTGEGDMFKPVTRSEKIATFAGDLMKDETDSFRRQLVEVLTDLDEKEWEVLAGIAEKLVKAVGY